MPTDKEIRDLAGWIYDTFDVEKRVSGYHPDRVISRADFIEAMLGRKNFNEIKDVPDPNCLLKVIVEIPVYSNPAVIHEQGVNPNWTSTQVDAIGDTMIEIGNSIKQGFTGRITSSVDGINWKMEIHPKRR